MAKQPDGISSGDDSGGQYHKTLRISNYGPRATYMRIVSLLLKATATEKFYDTGPGPGGSLTNFTSTVADSSCLSSLDMFTRSDQLVA